MNSEVYTRLHHDLKKTIQPMFSRNGLTKNISVDSVITKQHDIPISRTMSMSHGQRAFAASQKPSLLTTNFIGDQRSPYKSGVCLTTTDAHTLTDGPTIYLVEDVSRMGNYYAQYSHVPSQVLDSIMEKIEKNNQIQKKWKS